MTISAATRQNFVWLSAFCAVSAASQMQAFAQDYKPGDPIKFGNVHRPMYGVGGTASNGASYTAAPSAPSYADQGARSFSPAASAPQSTFNPANFAAQPVSPPSASLGSGGSPSGYTPPGMSALPPGELSPAPGTRPAQYGNPAGAQSFSQPPAAASKKHQHIQHQPHQHTPKQPKPTPTANQAGGTGGGDSGGGFWKALTKPFSWMGGLFK